MKPKISTSLLILSLAFAAQAVSAQSTGYSGCTGGNCPTGTVNNNYNTNNIANTNNNQAVATNNVNVKSFNTGGGFGGGLGTIIPAAPPAIYAGTPLYNSAWNFIPPHVLFHPSKTIGDCSIFSNCRLINVSTPLRTRLKDKLFGVFDDRKFVSSGVGNVGQGATFATGPAVVSDSMIVCGLNTNLPRKCVKFIGSGSISMEDYGTSEGALVGLAQMGAKYGANLVGNVNCAYAETITSSTKGLGVGGTISDNLGGDSFGSLSVGGNWGFSRTKRPVQPFCSGDFYIATLSGCVGKGVQHAPQPRLYRRYLPTNQAQAAPMPRYAQPQPTKQAAVSGLW